MKVCIFVYLFIPALNYLHCIHKIYCYTSAYFYLYVVIQKAWVTILKLPRGKLTLLIRAITNHNFLGAHQHNIDPDISKCCRFCEEEVETFAHLIHDCPALRLTRQDIYLDNPPLPGEPWNVKNLVKFIMTNGVFEALHSKIGLGIRDDPNEVINYDTDN